ncbi:MAG: EAL domain-containing protein [Nitratireductor sp.]|nr:EAL domain-containing protein [Nitratireductor sp.]
MPGIINSAIRRGRSLFRPGNYAVLIALLVSLAGGVFAEYQNRVVEHQRARTSVGETLGLVRAKLEGNINANIQLVRGLVAVIASQPDIDQHHFARIASSLIGPHSQLRNIAAAPDLVIRLMYPTAGNEKAIGLDYRTNETQREAALRAVKARNMVLAGPVDLLQGGQGFVCRFPVFVNDSQGEPVLWGLVSAVVDVERLYRESGLLDPDLPIRITIAGRDSTGGKGEVFFGSGDIFDEEPVVTEVALPSGSWQLAATPIDGWTDISPNAWRFRAVIFLAGLLIVLPVAIAGRLYDQRQENIRELRLRRDQLHKLSQRLKLALETSQIGVWELNLVTGEMYWDDRMVELYGLMKDTPTNEYDVWARALHPEDRKRAEEEFKHAIETGGTYASEFRVVLGDGTTRWIRAIGAVREGDALGESGPRYIVGVNWDVSSDVAMKTNLLAAKRNAEVRNHELEDARAQMEHISLHDSLTGLPNRRYLDKILDNGTAVNVTALLHIDLDRFKHINDTLGHAAGDHMLVHSASILKKNTRDGDFVARIGGDEFVIATTSPIDEEKLEEMAERIISMMRQPVSFGNHECRYGVSIGIAIADLQDNDYGKRLLIDADIALYRAKRNGRNRFEFFSTALKAEIIHNKRVADDILSGLERREFVPYFQPQFDAQTLELAGVEALARWNHPRNGVLTPADFLKTADELNVVPLIDRTILEQTLWHDMRWKSAGIDVSRISVNVSAGRLYDTGLIETLDGLDIKPGRLSFELLESIFLDEGNDVIAENFKRLKKLGIDIEIDDFGTGYASIISLINLRPTRLKIDRRLVAPVAKSESQRRLVSSIIEIGQSLGIKVVAEGVETMEQAAYLRDLGCDVLQGYAFARPMPSGHLMEFIRERRWLDVA